MSTPKGQMSTPLTEWTPEDEKCELEEGEEMVDGMDGWPHPSAVACIQDDLRRLCLNKPDLERMIASCVDEYLQRVEGKGSYYR